MVEIAKPDVQIILSIKEGKGFEQVLEPTLLIGTLNGHSLETNKIESSSNPQYVTDLIWETNKTALRKMRSGQASLKLECFTLKENEGKERIGYVLLNIRSAHVASKPGNFNPKASWHKLLGLRNDLKIYKPELFLTLRIKDQKNTGSNAIVEIRNTMIENDIILHPDEIIPYLHHDEQLIQLGPLNICRELFVLSITVTCIENLHLLLPEHSNADSTVCFSYKILENDVELRPFKIESGRTHLLNEKVIIRIRSSLSVLKYYLQLKPYLSVSLKYENDIVAGSLVNLQSLVPTDDLQEFLKYARNTNIVLHEQCLLTKQDLTENIQIQNSYIGLQVKLQYIGSKSNILQISDTVTNVNNHPLPDTQYHNEENMNNPDQKFTEIESHRNPSGDTGTFNGNSIPFETRYGSGCKNINKHSTDCQSLKNKIHKLNASNTMLCNCIKKNSIQDVESYNCYCLYISLVAITLVSSELSGQQIEFRFHHPKAELISTARTTITVLSGETIKLQDIECQFHFISASDDIKQLLQTFPPKISIYDTNAHPKLLSLSMFDLKPLFHQNKRECQYKLPLYDIDQNKIGDMDVILKLDNYGPHYTLKKETFGKNFGPPILDDSLAYKIVDELETWKDRQKEMFKVELKRKEERHLNILSEEWRKQKETLESKLACSIEQCKMLANSLNNATEDLRTRRLRSLENETRLIKANDDLQQRYETKIQELKDSLYVMQNNLTSKVTVLEEKKAVLEVQVETLLYENEDLKSSICKQTDELEMYQKGSLTQDQTTSVLQELKILEEKLNNAQKGKSFFKEQWGKSVREIHRMKVDHQRAMQIQIKTSKEELKNVDMAELLSIDTKALTNDQILLNELQKEIDVIKPERCFALKETYDQIFTPVHNVCPSIISTKTTSHKSEEYNGRLQVLTEERDSLLRTGSYAADDVVIKKLNNEIRSLLVNK